MRAWLLVYEYDYVAYDGCNESRMERVQLFAESEDQAVALSREEMGGRFTNGDVDFAELYPIERVVDVLARLKPSG